MNEHRRWVLETLIENFSTRIGQGLREQKDLEILDENDGLSTVGEVWVQGYLTAQMSVICGVTSGNPNLSAEEIETIASVVQNNSDQIAAGLYA
jgi:hypothetical protein